MRRAPDTERIRRPARRSERGSALIAVLWLSAALSVVALALAAQVRSEAERATALAESTRAYYLATGSLERARLWMQWGPVYKMPDGSPRYYLAPLPRMNMSYPDGVAVVEVIPESAKLNLNIAKPEELMGLMTALGAGLPRAQAITAAIIDWRAGGPSLEGSPFDAIYQASSFLAPHASFKQLEELLLVRGMTTDLFYGHFGANVTGEMVYFPGLRDCVTTYSNGAAKFDANSVPGPVLEAVGWPVAAVRALEVRRALRPLMNMNELADFLPRELLPRVGFGGGEVITLRATATLRPVAGRPAGVKRSVSEVVRIGTSEDALAVDPRPWVVLRWYDNETSPLLPQGMPVYGTGTPSDGSAGSRTTVVGTASPDDQGQPVEEPVKVYTTGAPATNPAAPQTAPAPAAASDKKTGAPPKEPVTVYRVSGSGAVESAPAGARQQ